MTTKFSSSDVLTSSRAYSALEAKAFDDEKRTFTGWATTPSTDRMQDSINPLGAKFKNPLVLLHQHRHDSPIGTVTFGEPTARGIPFEATIPEIKEAGPLRDRVETAWGEIKHGLVRAVSIGFRPLAYKPNEKGGYDFDEVEIFELSSVSIPANADAVITAIKNFDAAAREQAGVTQSTDDKPAATGKGHVVKLANPVRGRTKTFVIRELKRI